MKLDFEEVKVTGFTMGRILAAEVPGGHLVLNATAGTLAFVPERLEFATAMLEELEPEFITPGQRRTPAQLREDLEAGKLQESVAARQRLAATHAQGEQAKPSDLGAFPGQKRTPAQDREALDDANRAAAVEALKRPAEKAAEALKKCRQARPAVGLKLPKPVSVSAAEGLADSLGVSGIVPHDEMMREVAKPSSEEAAGALKKLGVSAVVPKPEPEPVSVSACEGLADSLAVPEPVIDGPDLDEDKPNGKAWKSPPDPPPPPVAVRLSRRGNKIHAFSGDATDALLQLSKSTLCGKAVDWSKSDVRTVSDEINCKACLVARHSNEA